MKPIPRLPQKPDVTVSIHGEQRLVIILKETNGDFERAEVSLTPGQLEQYRQNFYRELNQFRSTVKKRGKTDIDFGTVSKAMEGLYTHGAKLYGKLFGEQQNKAKRIFRLGCPNWKEGRSENDPPYLVEINSSIDHVLPFEFFPIFDPHPSPLPISSKKDLVSNASKYPGFSTIVFRTFDSESQDTPSTVLQNSERLSIRFFHNAELPGAAVERRFFEKQRHIDLRGPWPIQKLNKKQIVSDLAAQLYNACTGSGGQEPQALDQIQHFACHCNTNKSDSDHYSLSLAHRTPWLMVPFRREVTLGDLHMAFVPLRDSSPRNPSTKSYPLVFLNACGGSKLTPNGVTSFPELFLDMGNRGVIGTETNIPDAFAAEFSREFYKELIAGCELGLAIYRARRSLLWRFKNPLGILYAVYANPYLRVRRPIPREEP